MKFSTESIASCASMTIAFVAVLASFGCQTNTGTVLDNKTAQGAIFGTLAGAAAGAAIDDHSGRGALIGAAVGGVSGGLIGNYLENQAQEIDAIPDANVLRREDSLLVQFPGDVFFDSGSTVMHAGAHTRLRSLAESLRSHPDTDVIIRGHTDSTGSESYNLRLSDARADAVRRVLISEGVASYRISGVGMGSSLPVASNATAAGRQQNRRVEIEIRPNATLRERGAAEASRRPRY